MTGGRSFTFRRVTALAWSTAPGGSIAGLIKVELYKDPAHTEPIGAPKFYIGSVTAPSQDKDPAEAAYSDARRIVDYGTEIDPAKLGIDTAKNKHDTIEPAAR